jgi:hypothetical protein
VFGDFLALLDERERQVVLLLRSGITKVGDVASALGYKKPQPGLQAPGADPQESRRLFRGNLNRHPTIRHKQIRRAPEGRQYEHERGRGERPEA